MRITIAYLSSYFLSVLGNSIAAIALPLIILNTTGSALGAGTVAVATAIPALIAGVLMGVVIDRVNRRTSSIVTDLISGAAVAALPLIALFTELNLALFIIFGVIGALGDIPGMTARETLLPAVVCTSSLSSERLIGIRESLGAVGLVLGPALAGTLIALGGGTTVLWVTAAFSLAAAAVTLLIPHRLGAHGPVGRASSLFGWTELREGWSTLLRSPFLLMLVAMTFMAGMVLASFQGLILPVYFTALGQTPVLGFVLSAVAVGLLAGSGIYAVFAKRGRGRRAWLSTGLIGATVGLGFMSTLANVPIVLIGAFLTGLASGLFTSLIGVLMLERIPDGVRGRVLGTQNAAMTIAPPLGVMIAAIITETTGVGVAAIFATGIWAMMTIGVLVSKPLKNLAPLPEDPPLPVSAGR